SFSIARWVSRASVGCAIAFSWTVVSIATRSRSLVSIAPVRCATERLSCNSATICSSPSRWRQRVSDERSNGSSCRNTTSPQKYWKYGFSPHCPHSASWERLCICLRMNSPATSRVGNGGCPGPTRHTELKRPARKSQSISPASRTSGWRRLMISSRGGGNRAFRRSSRGRLLRLPPPADLAPGGNTDPPKQGNPTTTKTACTPGFLAKSITCSGQIIAIDQSLPNSSRTTTSDGRLGLDSVIRRGRLDVRFPTNDPTCADSGAQVLPPARATVPPSLRESSSRASTLPACSALGPPASAAQYSCRREPCTGRSAWLPLGRACLSPWIEHRSGERRSPYPGPQGAPARAQWVRARAQRFHRSFLPAPRRRSLPASPWPCSLPCRPRPPLARLASRSPVDECASP